MPILEVDGKMVVQTGAIARYCGKQVTRENEGREMKSLVSREASTPATTTGPPPRLMRSSTPPPT